MQGNGAQGEYPKFEGKNAQGKNKREKVMFKKKVPESPFQQNFPS